MDGLAIHSGGLLKHKPYRRLTAAEVLHIRQHENGIKHEAIAAEHGVARSTITMILNGQRWRWCWTPHPKFTAPQATVERTSSP